MTTLLAAYLAATVLVPLIARRLGREIFLAAATLPAVTLAWAFARAPEILAGSTAAETIDWVPELGLEIALRVDAFSLLMTILAAGMGTLIFLYSRWYFDDGPDLGRLAGPLIAFAGAMFGIVIADNLLALYVFWELTSITSYLLIGFDDRSAEARAAALRALLVTVAGGLAMLAGFILIGESAGTYSLTGVLANPPTGMSVEIGLLLVLFGAFTKSAQAPFHFWLPGAMAAPTPISAYLHSATMVKAGIYLIARLAPVFATLHFWRPLLVGVGLATMLIGGWNALRQRDLKLLLAHGTTSQLGLMTALFGTGIAAATLAGSILIVAHAAFKGALFMVVGIIDHQAGTRDIDRLDGLYRKLPGTFIATVLAVASMAGLPPLLGFIAKEAALEGFLEMIGIGWGRIALAVLVIGSALTFAYSLRFLWGAFAPKRADELVADFTGSETMRPEVGFLAPAAVLALLSLAFGIMPGTVDALIGESARALDPGLTPRRLALWHGLTPALLLSVAAILGGLLLWQLRREVARFQERRRFAWDAEMVYDQTVETVLRFANVVTGRLQTGSLPMYLAVILGTVVAIPGSTMIRRLDWWPVILLIDRPTQGVIALFMALAAILTVLTRRRMSAVVATSVVGYGVAFLFVVQGAPDLALTQLLFETLLLVLFVLILRHLPISFPGRGGRWWRIVRGGLAAAVGSFITLAALYAGSARGTAPPVSVEYLRRAIPEGEGRNVVNLILVDFRAFDTFGEIVVLTAAALGIMGLVRAARRGRGEMGESRTMLTFRPSTILDAAARIVFHTVLLYSIILLTVGHDHPGGGFIGGLVAGAAFILIYLAGGTPWMRRVEPAPPELLLGTGLTLAAVVGATGWLRGSDFLEATSSTLLIPGVGTIDFRSVFLFDLGVYLVVLGLVIALLGSAGQEEVRQP